ncbi:hypothetical protein GCM10023093_23160 [Nemorincola caseinilytica]|uniref:Phospholipid/glycerol acyltransferase domain-containing protein n=2 Tax=Nemorincola caseinilytica TaxID=2054315 RepID=A0ABP8NJE5_9BACT
MGIRLSFTTWSWLTGMPLWVRNKTAKGRYIYIANHASYIDDINIFPAIKGHFRPLGKKEMTKVPIWGYLYKHVVIVVDRKSPESRAASMAAMAHTLATEGSILIFPEGTFNATDRPLKDFYDGAFRLAIDTGTPIVPIIFPDAEKRAPHTAWWKIWPGRNRAFHLAPIHVNGMTTDDLPALKAHAYSIMEKELLRHARQ